MKKQLLILSLPFFLPLLGDDHPERYTSFPYITGDGFRHLADFLLVETTSDSEIPSIIRNFKAGQKIFVKTDYLQKFFDVVHPQLSPYILITHNSDIGAPGKFISFLESPKLIAWFCENCNTTIRHPKLYPIPIGTCNGHSMKEVRHFTYEEATAMRELSKSTPKDILLYMNFYLWDGLPSRQSVYDLFKNKSFCFYRPHTSMQEYFKDLARCKFVLSPPGMGMDCYRTWEALLMGAIPIVLSNTLNPLYEDLPVLIINDWRDITPEFLEAKYKEMASKQYKMEKILLPYWSNLMNEVQCNYYLRQ